MGQTNPYSGNSFRDLNELIDQKDAPGWYSKEIALNVDLFHLYEKNEKGILKRQELVRISVVGMPRRKWVFPKAIVPAMVDGFRLALAYRNPGLESSPSGHIIRRIILRNVVKPSTDKQLLSVHSGLLGDMRPEDKFIIAVKYRLGRTHDGVILRERLVILSNMFFVLMLPESKIDQLISLLLRACHNPPIIHLFNADKFHHVGTVR